jgi:hypothetical protein
VPRRILTFKDAIAVLPFFRLKLFIRQQPLVSQPPKLFYLFSYINFRLLRGEARFCCDESRTAGGLVSQNHDEDMGNVQRLA